MTDFRRLWAGASTTQREPGAPIADLEMDLEGELARLAGLATDPATPGAARGHLLERVALLQQQLRARRRGS